MIKQSMPKSIVFDEVTFIKNLNNWVMVTEDGWNELEWEGEGSQYFEFELEWKVNNQIIITCLEVEHRWIEDKCEGDYWTPPSCEIRDEEVDVYVTSMYNCDTGVEYDIDSDFVYQDICERLGYHIQDEYYFG
jgi:hypothetical protein